MATLASFCLKGAAQGACTMMVLSWAHEGDVQDGLSMGAQVGLITRLATAAIFQVTGIGGLIGTLGGIALSVFTAAQIYEAQDAPSFFLLVGMLSEIGVGYGLVGLGQRAIALFA